MKTPVVIGVTGHRDLREQDLPVLRMLIRKELERIRLLCPHSPAILLDSLAAGADLLCAEEAVRLGMTLVCPLPMPIEEYRKDFTAEEEAVLDRLLDAAANVFIAPASEPERPGRDHLYRQAGLYVASHCHVLFALWDGSPETPGGCGTAEITAFKRAGCRLGADSGPTAERSDAVLHVSVPRRKSGKEIGISARLLENTPGKLEKLLKDIDADNAGPTL